jgi:hypothetical protein
VAGVGGAEVRRWLQPYRKRPKTNFTSSQYQHYQVRIYVSCCGPGHDHVDWNTSVNFARPVQARTINPLERQNVQIGIASDTQPHNAPLSCMRLREPCFVILFPYDSSLATSARTSPLTFSVSLSDCPSSFAWALSTAAACSSAASAISTSPAGAAAAAGCAAGDSGGVGTAVGDCVLDSVAGTGSATESSNQHINIETIRHGLTHRSWLES